MMRQRVLWMGVLSLNLLLAVGWYAAWHRSSALYEKILGTETASAQGKTNMVLRRQFFSWREVESDDYPTYIANLRDIGCPEQTIRDIIIADVNGLYTRRRALEIVTPEQQWWRTEPDSNVVQVATEKSRVLDD